MIVRSVLRESADRVGGAAQIAGDEREVGRLDRHVGAGAHRHAQVGLRQRGGVVDAVADHRHHAALRTGAGGRRPPSPSGMTSGDHVLDADLGGDGARGRLGCRRSAAPAAGPGRAAAATASALVGRTVSARPPAPRTAPSHATATAVRPAARARSIAAATVRRGSRPRSASSAGRPTTTACPSTTPSTPRPARLAKPSGGGSAPGSSRAARRSPAAMGCSEPSSSAPASRSTSARRRRRPGPRRPAPSRPSSRCRSCRARPCRSRRVDSSTSGPRIRIPSWAPRPVPTSSAVGVARPSAHGQAMIRTATAAVKANVRARAGGQPAGEGHDGQREHRRHEHRRDPVGEPLDGRLAGLRLRHQPPDPGERRVGAHAGGAHHEAPAGVDGRAGDRVARGPPRRGRSRPSAATRRWPSSLPRRRRRWRSARPGAPRTGRRRRSSAAGTRRSAPSSPRTRRLLRAQLQQRPQGRARAALGPGLEPAAREQERGDDGAHLQVDLVAPAPRSVTIEPHPHVRVARAEPTSATTDQPQAASVPSETSVSMVAAPWRRFAHAARWNGHPAHRTTGVARASATHCQPSNWRAGIIDSSTTGTVSAADTRNRRRSGAAGRLGGAGPAVRAGAGRRAP